MTHEKIPTKNLPLVGLVEVGNLTKIEVSFNFFPLPLAIYVEWQYP
ncbi:hypothetical protein [Okeania sp. SIO1I7]|nr:hypothetical protein [Okeania sp. SIO1I7]